MLAGLRADQPTNGLFYFPQVDGHHSAVRQQHGHRNVNVLKGLQLAAHQLAVVAQVAVHHRCRFQPLNDGFHQNRIQGDLGFAGRAQFLKLGHQVGYIRLIYISHMGDLLPALGGHIGNNLSLNVEVFGSCDFHTCASPLVTVFSNCIAEIRCGILLTVLVSRAFPEDTLIIPILVGCGNILCFTFEKIFATGGCISLGCAIFSPFCQYLLTGAGIFAIIPIEGALYDRHHGQTQL